MQEVEKFERDGLRHEIRVNESVGADGTITKTKQHLEEEVPMRVAVEEVEEIRPVRVYHKKEVFHKDGSVDTSVQKMTAEELALEEEKQCCQAVPALPVRTQMDDVMDKLNSVIHEVSEIKSMAAAPVVVVDEEPKGCCNESMDMVNVYTNKYEHKHNHKMNIDGVSPPSPVVSEGFNYINIASWFFALAAIGAIGYLLVR